VKYSQQVHQTIKDIQSTNTNEQAIDSQEVEEERKREREREREMFFFKYQPRVFYYLSQCYAICTTRQAPIPASSGEYVCHSDRRIMKSMTSLRLSSTVCECWN
jgi:hypothetical protein